MSLLNKGTNYLRNATPKLYNAVSTPIASTCDALAKRLQSVCDIAYLLYQKTKVKLGYGDALKDTIENEVEEDYIDIEGIKHLFPREKTHTSDYGIEDMQYLFNEHDMRLIEDDARVKLWRVAKYLNQPLQTQS